MKNNENDSIFHLSMVPWLEQNTVTQHETNLTPINVNYQHLPLEVMYSSGCAPLCVS